MMKLAFAINDRNRSWISSLICIFTKAKAYHCELIFSDGNGVSAFPSEGITFGPKDYNDTYSWVQLPLYWINEYEEQAIRNELQKIMTESKGYDYIGATFGKYWHAAQDSRRWFCSELCATLIAPYVDTIKPHDKWYSPDELWKDVSWALSMDRYVPYFFC